MKRLLGIICMVVLLTGCVTNKKVSKTEISDHKLTCSQLQYEIANMESLKEDFSDDSGITAKNVGMALIFWPGILVNELNASQNINSVERRLEHLHQIYAKKCV